MNNERRECHVCDPVNVGHEIRTDNWRPQQGTLVFGSQKGSSLYLMVKDKYIVHKLTANNIEINYEQDIFCLLYA